MWENLFSFKKTKIYILGKKIDNKNKIQKKKLEKFKSDNLEKKRKRKTFFF